MIELRPYQLDGEEAIRQAFRDHFCAALYVLPTGGGKTYLLASITASAERRGKRIAILCHRMELVDQIVESLRAFDVDPDIVCAGYERKRSHVLVASVQTLIRRIDTIQAPDLIIIDEAHHCANGNTWSQILTKWSGAKRLGVTATPVRLDGRGLAHHFDKMILGPSVSWLTEHGYLAPAKVFAPPAIDISGLHSRAGDYVSAELELAANKPSITGDAIAEWRRHGQERSALVFAVSVAHADAVAKQFRDAGAAALSFSGKTDRQLRREILKDFKRGAIRVLCQCDLANEGFDIPGAHVGIMLRPTQSLALWRQQLGRVLRPAEGKPNAIILDAAGNTAKFGLPTDEPSWSLAYDEDSRKKSKREASVRICASCFAASGSSAQTCVECGSPFPIKPRQIEARDGELVELTAEILARKQERRAQGMAQTLDQLREVARQRGYKPNWAEHIYAARLRKREAMA